MTMLNMRSKDIHERHHIIDESIVVQHCFQVVHHAIPNQRTRLWQQILTRSNNNYSIQHAKSGMSRHTKLTLLQNVPVTF
jgi:hypothetical protein